MRVSPGYWLNNVARAARCEVGELHRAPQEVLFCLYLPVIWILVVWFLLGDGMMTDVPVGFEDLDHTGLTREIGRSLDSNRALSLQSYAVYEEAASAMRGGEIYALIAIAPGYTRELQRGRGSALELYLDETRFAAAGTLQFAVSATVSALSMEQQATTVLKTGNGVGVRPASLPASTPPPARSGTRRTVFWPFSAASSSPASSW